MSSTYRPHMDPRRRTVEDLTESSTHAVQVEPKTQSPLTPSPTSPNNLWPSNIEYIRNVEYADPSLKPRGIYNDPCGCMKNADGSPSCNSCECVLFACQEECNSNCLAGDLCANKRITRREWKQVSIVNAGGKGFGICALEDIKEGDLIIEYVGVIQSEEYLKSREYLYPERYDTNEGVANAYTHSNHRFIMSLCPGLFLDARYKGNEARFVNHSCRPNCKMDRWKVRSRTRVALFAIQDIKKGSELTFDYAWEPAPKEKLTKCLCGESNCRGSLEIGVLEQSDLSHAHDYDFEKNDEQDIHSHWVKPPSDYFLDVGSLVKILFEGNAEYYIAKIVDHDSQVKGRYLVKFDVDGEESWENMNQVQFLILEKASVKLNKRLATPNKQQSLVSRKAMAPHSIRSPRTSEDIKIYDERVRKELYDKEIVQKCECYFQVKIQWTTSGVLVSGIRANAASGYLKHNIINLQQPAALEASPSKRPLVFSQVTKKANKIAFIPNHLIDSYLKLVPFLRGQCQNCKVRNIADLRANDIDIPSRLDGMYALFEATLVSDLHKLCTIIQSHVKVYWFSGEVEGNREIRAVLREHMMKECSSFQEAPPPRHKYLGQLVSHFEDEAGCRVLCYPYSPTKFAIFIHSYPMQTEMFNSHFKRLITDIQSGVKYIYAPQQVQNRGVMNWLKKLGANVSANFPTTLFCRVAEGPYGGSDAVNMAEKVLLAQNWLSNRACFRRRKWAFGADAPKSSTIVTVVSESSLAELVDICSGLKLEAGVAVHTMVILRRFLGVCGDGNVPKIREVTLAALYLANKSQKIKRWKKLEQLLQKAYHVWYGSSVLDLESEEASVVAKRILFQEECILKALHNNIFYKNNLESILVTLQSYSKSNADTQEARKLIFTSASLHCMWECGIVEVVVAIWVLNSQLNLLPIMSKYSLSKDSLAAACGRLIEVFENSISTRILQKMKNNFDALSRSKLNTHHGIEKGCMKLILSSPDCSNFSEITNFLNRMDECERSIELARALGPEISLELKDPTIELCAYSHDNRCLFVAYEDLCRLLVQEHFDVNALCVNFIPAHDIQCPKHVSKPSPVETLTDFGKKALTDTGRTQSTLFQPYPVSNGPFVTGKMNLEGSNLDWLLSLKHGISDAETLERRNVIDEGKNISEILHQLGRKEGVFSLLPYPSCKAIKREDSRSGKFSMGVSAASLQELFLLHQLLPHPNFISPINIYSDNVNKKHLVVTEMICSFQKILNRRKNNLAITSSLIRTWFRDLTSMMAHCHSHYINIRTLNPDNILLTHNGVAQLSNLNCCSVILPFEQDAKSKFDRGGKGVFNNKQADKISDVYVAPEIVLGAPSYSFQSDIWCLATVLSYLFLSKPLFPPRKSAKEYIASVYKVVGSPSENNWPAGKSLPHYKKYKASMRYRRGVEKALNVLLSQTANDTDLAVINCLCKFLHLDPDRRLRPEHALREDEYLKEAAISDANDIRANSNAFARDWILVRDQILFCDSCGQSKTEDTKSMHQIQPNPSAPVSYTQPAPRNKTQQYPIKSLIRKNKSSLKRSTDDFLNELSNEEGESEDDDLYDMGEERLFGSAKKPRG